MASIAEINGMQSVGVIAHVKHIAFNDQEDQRAGGAVWLNEQSAREVYLLPFEYALSSAEGMGNAHGVMSAMNRVGAIWVGASDNLLNNIMRDEWAFDGYCITDMAASNTAFIMTYQDGIPNGTDLYMGSGSESALSSLKSNVTFACALREASHHILYAIANYSAAMNGMTPTTPVGSADWWWRTALIAAISVVAVITAGSAAMYVVSVIKENKAKKNNE